MAKSAKKTTTKPAKTVAKPSKAKATKVQPKPVPVQKPAVKPKTPIKNESEKPKRPSRVLVKVIKKATVPKASKPAVKKKVEKITTPLQHALLPEHIKLNDKEKDDLMNKYHIQLRELPKISINDQAIRHLGIKERDIIKIIRKSPTGGTTIFFRGVVNE
ncbi:MAG: DNA-directed RNA polymerase subunit RpoH/Rpb5 C-terminal domain-containing protein [archaeon]